MEQTPHMLVDELSPELPRDVLRIIWQTVWRAQAASQLQCAWRARRQYRWRQHILRCNTLRSKLKAPLGPYTEETRLNIRSQEALAGVIRRAHILLWDETALHPALLANAVDESLRNIRQRPNEPFGGRIEDVNLASAAHYLMKCNRSSCYHRPPPLRVAHLRDRPIRCIADMYKGPHAVVSVLEFQGLSHPHCHMLVTNTSDEYSWADVEDVD